MKEERALHAWVFGLARKVMKEECAKWKCS